MSVVVVPIDFVVVYVVVVVGVVLVLLVTLFVHILDYVFFSVVFCGRIVLLLQVWHRLTGFSCLGSLNASVFFVFFLVGFFS